MQITYFSKNLGCVAALLFCLSAAIAQISPPPSPPTGGAASFSSLVISQTPNTFLTLATDVNSNPNFAWELVHELKSKGGNDLNLRAGAATGIGAGLEDIQLYSDAAIFLNSPILKVRPTASGADNSLCVYDKNNNPLFCWTNDITFNKNSALNAQRAISLFSIAADTGPFAGSLFYRSDLARPRYYDTTWHSLVGADTTDTLSNKTLTAPMLSGVTNGTGLQIFNTTTTCTTAATAGATCTTAPITLPIGYSDTNYRMMITGLSPTNVPIVQTIAKSNTTFTITIAALTAAAATYGSFDVTVAHN